MTKRLVVSSDNEFWEGLKSLVGLHGEEAVGIRRLQLICEGGGEPVIVILDKYVRLEEGAPVISTRYNLIPMENTNEGQDDTVREVEEDSGGSEDSGDMADSKA